MRFPVTHRAYQHRPKQDPFPRASRGAPTATPATVIGWAVGNPQGMFAARKLPALGASVALQLLCSCSCGNHARNRQARPRERARGSATAPACWSTPGVLVRWSGSKPHTHRDTRRSVRGRGAQSAHVHFHQSTLQLPIRTCPCATQIKSANAAAVSQTSSTGV